MTQTVKAVAHDKFMESGHTAENLHGINAFKGNTQTNTDSGSANIRSCASGKQEQ